MSQVNKTSTTIATGLAMFSMFFGAGNVVFPLALGQIAQDKNLFAMMGMLLTAVGVPFLGLIAMALFDGDYKKFFGRIGTVPGFVLAAFIMCLIGPFGAIPRCIALSFSTMQTLFPHMNIYWFSAIACAIIWLFTFKKNTIVDSLGYFLTPILLISLGAIIAGGIFFGNGTTETTLESSQMFIKGLVDGYQTMDLLGAFFFSAVIVQSLKNHLDKREVTHKRLMITTLKSCVIGASCLAFAYIGFSYVSAFNSSALQGVPSDQLISMVAIHVLGPHAAIIACTVVAMACLTTAIALASVFAEFIHLDIAQGKIGYQPSLIITLVLSFIFSTFEFSGIVGYLVPILQICYPALILMSILNVAYKLYDFKPIKVPVLIAFIVSLGFYLWG